MNTLSSVLSDPSILKDPARTMHFPLRDRTLAGSALRIALGLYVSLSLGFVFLKLGTPLFERPEPVIAPKIIQRPPLPPPINPVVYADPRPPELDLSWMTALGPNEHLIDGQIITLRPGQEVYEGRIGRWIDVVATAYTPSDPLDGAYHATKGKWRWKTADGRTDVRVEHYGIAVPLARDSRGRKLRKPWYPFGTEIIIPTGYGYLDRIRANERSFRIDDVGNGKEYFATKNGKLHIDLRFRDRPDAIKWAGPKGYRELRVFLVEE